MTHDGVPVRDASWTGNSPTRRFALRSGLGAAVGLTLPELLQQRSRAKATGRSSADTALILVWLPGGHSHLETYDPKPLAPSDYRGPYGPIETAVPGMRLCELLPHHARVADRFCLLRSVVHTGFCHQQGTHQLLTGFPERVLRPQPRYPDFLSVTHRLRYDRRADVPNYVGIPPINYSGAAYLGNAYAPFPVHGDPASESFAVPNIGSVDEASAARMKRRVRLREQLDRLKKTADHLAGDGALDEFEQQAISLLTGTAASRAFDISREPDAVRDRYGRNRWGQQMLLARRLVEAGVDLVTVQLGGALCGGVGNWDDHAVNANCFEAIRYRLQFMDRAVAGLVEDLFDRGLDRRVLVVVTGEFGRTPKIRYQKSTGRRIGSAPAGTMQPGRDHWPRATSMLFAGGGIEPGQVIGRTDVRGEDVTQRRVGRGDFLATLYRHLGVDFESVSFEDHSGRPVPLMHSPGKPIPELCAAGDPRTA